MKNSTEKAKKSKFNVILAESMNGIPKGLCSFGQVKGDSPQGGEMARSDRGAGAVSLGQSPAVTKRTAKGEFPNSPVDCF